MTYEDYKKRVYVIVTSLLTRDITRVDAMIALEEAGAELMDLVEPCGD